MRSNLDLRGPRTSVRPARLDVRFEQHPVYVSSSASLRCSVVKGCSGHLRMVLGAPNKCRTVSKSADS
eukprot:15445447-Alexandrium_andersonii.AAC.1